MACPSRRFFAAHFELFPVFHPSTLTTFLNTSEETFDCGNFFSNKTFEVFQRNCVKFMEMQDCAFHTALQDWGQLHFKTEQIPEIPKMAKNIKNFKEVTTTFTSWQLLTIIVNCCILDLNSTNPNEDETQRSSKNKQQHSQVEIFTLRWDVMKTAKSRDCYATVCWCFSECSRECCLDIFVEVAPVTSPCFLRFLQPLMTWSGGKNQFPQSYGTLTGCPICDLLLRALCLWSKAWELWVTKKGWAILQKDEDYSTLSNILSKNFYRNC